MAQVRPFKAIRPSPSLADKVAALPYDVMSSEEARKMVVGNPYSFLHVDKAEIDLDESVDHYSNAVYEKAAETLQQMISDGTFEQDSAPLFYLYRLTMNGRSQTGLVACASVDEYLSGSIKKHELTLEAKEHDRINHVKTTDANTGPIFLTYRAKKEIDEFVEKLTSESTPIYDFVSDDGIGHTVWKVEASTDFVSGLFCTLPALYIADGHHRAASAVKVAQMKRQENPNYTGAEEFNAFLAVIFPHDQLYIMDYNRIVKISNGLSPDGLLQAAAKHFDIEAVNSAYSPEARHTFGVYCDGKWYKLTAKPEFVDESDSVRALDVSVLQELLITPVLGIGDTRVDKNIEFSGGVRGLEFLAEQVDSKKAFVAFSMFPTSITELMDVADSGKIMPPKSTWFEPKLRSGLFIHKLS